MRTIQCANCGQRSHRDAVGCPACGADPRTGVVTGARPRARVGARSLRGCDEQRLEPIAAWVALIGALVLSAEAAIVGLAAFGIYHGARDYLPTEDVWIIVGVFVAWAFGVGGAGLAALRMRRASVAALAASVLVGLATASASDAGIWVFGAGRPQKWLFVVWAVIAFVFAVAAVLQGIAHVRQRRSAREG